MLLTNLTFVDVETTGLSPVRDRIIEIGILRMQNGRITRKLNTLINPDCSIPPEITMLTGITGDQLDSAPVFSRIAPDIAELFRDSVFVAHNARFDYAFLRAEFARMGLPFSAPTLCTAKLSRRLFPRHRHHNLDSLIDRFRLTCDIRHRAFADAQVLAQFWRKARKQFSGQVLAGAITSVMKSAALPGTISKQIIASLPESPGVYIFYGKEGIPLYIGKSVNIKERVLSHFYDYSRSAKESKIYSTIASIEAIPTSGELGALLLESSMIKQMQPAYNRMLRKRNSLIAVFRNTTPEGYLTVDTRLLASVTPENIENIIAVFRTQGQLKQALIDLARTHALCQKLLGVEKTSGRCFGSQIETCHGACTGKELPARYNVRFTEAFFRTRVKQWPFSGPIAVREGDSTYIVYKWCYLGTQDELDITGTNLPASLAFDYDTYKILASYLLKKTRDERIHIIQNTGYVQDAATV